MFFHLQVLSKCNAKDILEDVAMVCLFFHFSYFTLTNFLYEYSVFLIEHDSLCEQISQHLIEFIAAAWSYCCFINGLARGSPHHEIYEAYEYKNEFLLNFKNCLKLKCSPFYINFGSLS